MRGHCPGDYHKCLLQQPVGPQAPRFGPVTVTGFAQGTVTVKLKLGLQENIFL